MPERSTTGLAARIASRAAPMSRPGDREEPDRPLVRFPVIQSTRVFRSNCMLYPTTPNGPASLRRGAIGLAIVWWLFAPGSASNTPSAGQRLTFLPTTHWGDWVEKDFPFFSSVVDVRDGGLKAGRNLTPRGVVIDLGRGFWAAFDVDLLRVAAIWNGNAVTAKALAPGSYHIPDRKTPGGQSPLPEPAGRVWMVNGLYPGWQIGERLTFDDPREPAPTITEVGRGPLAEDAGRFKAVRLVRGGVIL